MRFMQMMLILTFTTLSAGQGSSASPGMTHEEEVVRTTYARLSYAVQVGEVLEILQEADFHRGPTDQESFARRLKDAELTFELSEFKVGSVTDPDIQNVKYKDLMTWPSGDSLDITPGVSSFNINDKETNSPVAKVQWHASQQIRENWDLPWRELFPQIEHSNWFSTYASFKVKVTFQGSSREYRAMFLFGRNPAG